MNEYSHILSARRQTKESLVTCFNKYKHCVTIKTSVKSILQKQLSSLFFLPNTLKRGTWPRKKKKKSHENSLLPTSEVLWWAAPDGINSSHKHYARDVTPAMEPFRKMQSALKILIRVVLLVVFFNYIVRFCTIKTIMLLGI